MHTYRSILLTAIVGMAIIFAGCQSYVNVPPDKLGMKLTPTGYEDHIYTPGQVNIGKKSTSGLSNSLVLIQRSGLQIKEPFLGSASSGDKEDHRCLTHDRVPMTLDVRLLLAIPDHETEQGKKDLARLFLLGNPIATKENARVLELSAESVYAEQARLQVRGAIRRICATYEHFEDAFAAFASVEEGTNFSDHITRAVVRVLNDQHVPLHVIAAQVSNMKPDDSVVEAQVALRAAEERVKAIETVVKYLGNDPVRQMVYKMQVLQEIVNRAGTNGHNTLFLTDMASNAQILPLPLPTK